MRDPPQRLSRSKIPLEAPDAPNAEPSEPTPSVDQHPFFLGAMTFLRNAEKYGGRRETNDVEAVSRLFAEFLIENGVHDLRHLVQSHFSKFRDLFNDLPTYWGKLSRDACLADYRKRGASLPKCERGISGKTWNKHISSLSQVAASIVAEGGVVGVPGLLLDPGKLRVKRLPRGRGKREQFTREDLDALFHFPLFTGCRGWERRDPFIEGPHIYHRALYFAPMLLCYTGARRDEICGLCCDDVVINDVVIDAQIPEIPHIHIRANVQRKIKNDQSDRILRSTVKFFGSGLPIMSGRYALLDMSLGSRSLFADDVVAVRRSFLRRDCQCARDGRARTGSANKVLHSPASRLSAPRSKGDGFVSEVRADLLGHKGKTVTDEIYVAASTLEDMSRLIHRLPIVTAHLRSSEIKLVPWVEKKLPAPWGRAAQANHGDHTAPLVTGRAPVITVPTR